ncbi:hypothetical protein EJ02DRAFT_394187 [Clathrospora elynae]|uniref:Flavin reductase like domain-containing protein n=1 Tax=Clathrospora elynae TaxID=706981 RepID=A0A6A5T453_9PLEO|nr:hypothetical protein EJ02DRAFT_394187 [Clathrospora elynae]
MTLSQRPASRFFAAFYRWNLQTQRPQPCAIASQCGRDSKNQAVRSCTPRNYHATRLLRQQRQPEPQAHKAPSKADANAIVDGSCRGGERIFRPVSSAHEEGAPEQPGPDEQHTPLEPSESELEAAKLKSSVRGLMRNVPSSVAVITVASIDPDTNKHVPMGVAVSSLRTVTLDPPTISFNIKEPSKTLDAIRAANGLFRVHFPGADRDGATIVELFCRGNHPDAYSLRSKDLNLHIPEREKNTSVTSSLAPQIWEDSILAAMECTVTHELPVADHVILVARVDSLEQKISKQSTIIYVNGGYQRSNGTPITTHSHNQFTPSEGSRSVWDYPLFPGAQERREYMEQIKSIVKGNPAYYENPDKTTYKSLEFSLPYPSTAFGINLEPLVTECRQEMGLEDERKADFKDHKVLSDFYGQLSPSTMGQIVDRARRLVVADSRFLSQDYRSFLHHLGVSPASKNLLPSDIMEPLRARGLANDFEPRRGHYQSTTFDIQKVEQIEFQLRRYLRTMKYEAALKTSLENAMEAIGEKTAAAYFFKKSRTRLLTQAHPHVFDTSAGIDIAGHLTQEEVRVVMSRIINRLHVRSLKDFRRVFMADWHEILRRIGVNPTITGMDVEFLMGKIKHLYYSTEHYHDFPRVIDKMLEPWFAKNVSWDHLEERVKQFVQKIPLRATTWSKRDRLAAMGLDWEATVTLPKQDSLPGSQQQPLYQGHILDILVAKELKNHYGKGTEEENAGIAKYLKETYNFDVQAKPIQYTSAELASRSSSDEMQEAMMASRNVDVSTAESSSEIMQEAVIGNSGRVQGADARRIRYRPQPKIKGPEKSKPRTEWTSYTLDGEKKQ